MDGERIYGSFIGKVVGLLCLLCENELIEVKGKIFVFNIIPQIGLRLHVEDFMSVHSYSFLLCTHM